MTTTGQDVEAADTGDRAGDRLTLFAWLVGGTQTIHLLAFGEWMAPVEPSGWVLLLVAAGLLLVPRASALLVAAAALAVFREWHRLPAGPNHMLFEALVMLAVLTAAAWTARRHGLRWMLGRRDHATDAARADFAHAFMPAVRGMLIVLYGYVVLHKLNADFFNREVSCGVVLLEMELSILPVTIKPGPAMEWFAIVSTIFFEALIPLLLLFRRTALLGVLVGVAFHLGIGAVPHAGVYSFTAMLWCMFALFLPHGVVHTITQRAATFRDKLGITRTRALIVAALALVWLGAAYAHRIGGPFNPQDTSERFDGSLGVFWYGFWVWILWCGGTAVVLLVATCRTPRGQCSTPSHHTSQPRFRTRPAWLAALFVGLTLFNGASPYLGLKTVTSFAMFANLRTEGELNNHLFLGRLQGLGHQDNLIEVLDTTDGRVAYWFKPDLLHTVWEFRRITGPLKGDYTVTYRRPADPSGVTHTLSVVNGRSSDPTLTTPLPWLPGKLIGYRPLDAGPHMGCRH